MKKKIKLMILHNVISPYRNPLFEELSKKYDLTVYFCKEKDKERKWSTKLKGYSFKYNILPHKNIGPFVLNPTIKKELKKENFDVYILADNLENYFSERDCKNIAEKNKIKLIIWNEKLRRDYSPTKSKFPKGIKNLILSIYAYFRRMLYNKSVKFISFCNESDKFLLSQGVNKNKIIQTRQIMPEYCLSKPTWKEKTKEFKDKKIIFNMGYLTERKGVNYLIEAFNKLNRKDVLLLIAGTGDQEDNLKKLSKDNKNIIFLSYKDGVDKANYYSISDFFVFPTLHDCWGFVVNEAFYYGIPIISTDKAGAVELIEEGKTGLIVPDKDSDALAEAMEKLLANPQLLKKMKENVKRIPKSKIVDIKTTANSFEMAINYAIGRIK